MTSDNWGEYKIDARLLKTLRGFWVSSLNKTGVNWFEVERVFSSDLFAISQSSGGGTRV